MTLWVVGVAAVVFLSTTLILCRVVVEQQPDLGEAVKEILENSETRVHVILAQTRRDLSQKEIRWWMSVMYRETVLLAVDSGGFTAHLSLAFFNVLFLLLWLKSWVFPRPRDLRVVLGGEMFIMCQLVDSD